MDITYAISPGNKRTGKNSHNYFGSIFLLIFVLFFVLRNSIKKFVTELCIHWIPFTIAQLTVKNNIMIMKRADVYMNTILFSEFKFSR